MAEADFPSRAGVNGHGPAPMGREALAHLLAGQLGGQPPAQPLPAVPPRPGRPPGPGAAGGAGPAAVPPLAGAPAAVLPIAWEVIEALQGEVSAKLTAQDPERTLAEPDRRALARSLVHAAVADWATTYAHDHAPLSQEDEVRIASAVYDAMFRGGRLQSLLDEDGVEDVMVDGLTAHVEYFDKPRRTIEKVADSHDELITWVNRMARQSGQGERALTRATPMVGFRMPDGSRVTASVLTSRPSVVIRKHRILQHGMGDLVQWQSINPLLERFLVACVKARMNLLVVGDMGAGKTSLLRALGREIPASERVVTLESDRELYLDEPGPRPGAITFAFEARQSNGERAAGDRLAGEVTISDMFATALRYNATRVIVGEVRSTEIVPMLQAMSAGGSGSMCTLHVRRPHAVVSRLVQLCAEAGLPLDAAHYLIASALDVVVYLTYLDETAIGGRRHRFVSHIYEIDDVVGEAGRPALTELFAPVPGEPRAVYQHMPSFIDALERTGLIHRSWLAKDPHTWWGQPLQLEDRP
ncbi:CpaF family protein [Streptomyces sp. NPDC057620]|uniref:CpaF family protein n=1 Tax=Streptomyces sp. NPDC057620 TaxID=3346185 RepID=UPI0036AAC260